MKFSYQPVVLFIICLLLFFIPIINLGNQYIVGGDDMKLYYIFPELYLKNYSFNLISDNTLAGALTGYSSIAYFAPFYFIIYVLKIIPLNTQALMYGLNFSFGFLFAYKLIGLYADNLQRNWKVFLAKTLAGIFFVFSPFLNETLYSHQLVFIYLVSVLPATLYFIVLGIREKSFKFTLISVLVFSILSTTYASLPVSAAFLITVFPLLIYEFWSNKISFIKYVAIWGTIFFGLNFYWIIHLIYGTLYNTGLTNSIDLFSSGQVQVDNIRIITAVATQYSPLNQIFISIRYGVYQVTILDIIRSVFLIIILSGGFFACKANSKFKYKYLAVLLGLVLSWFLFSPNFGSWGPQVFVRITEVFPLFGMFRNMQDKFALSLAFFYALSFGISLSVVTARLKSQKITKILFILVILVLLLNIPRIINPQIPDRDGLSRISGKFNADYINLIEHIKNISDSSRIMWIPLNFPTYANIADNNGNFYSGLSPIRVLANKSDFSGKFSFLTQNDVYLGDKVLQWLEAGSYQEVARLAQTLNIQYIIVDHQEVLKNLLEFYYGGKELPILLSQNDEFKKEILGEKLKDFGNTYSLYEINSAYQSSKIFLSNANPLFYQKLNSSEYIINIDNLNTDAELIFLEPYNSKWTLYVNDTPYKKGQNKVVYDYANSWDIKVDELGNSENLVFRLYFEPDRLNIFGYSISIVTLICGMFFIFFKHKRR